jgi:hypothetical protein
MHVRWKTRSLHSQWDSRGEHRYSLCAQVVASYRTGRQVRQKVILYLGVIKEERISSPLWRDTFWEAAMARLAARRDFDPLARRRIRQALRERVPRPTPMEVAEENKRLVGTGSGADEVVPRFPRAGNRALHRAGKIDVTAILTSIYHDLCAAGASPLPPPTGPV